MIAWFIDFGIVLRKHDRCGCVGHAVAAIQMYVTVAVAGVIVDNSR